MEWEYGKAKIVFTDTNRFKVLYGDEEGKTYASFDEATSAINAREEREEKVNRVKISVPVVCRIRDTNKISQHVITGIHGGHGGYIAKPPTEKYGASLYFDHPAVLKLLKELAQAEACFKRAQKAAAAFELSTSDWDRKAKGLTTADGLALWQKEQQAAADALAAN